MRFRNSLICFPCSIFARKFLYTLCFVWGQSHDRLLLKNFISIILRYSFLVKSANVLHNICSLQLFLIWISVPWCPRRLGLDKCLNAMYNKVEILNLTSNCVVGIYVFLCFSLYHDLAVMTCNFSSAHLLHSGELFLNNM